MLTRPLRLAASAVLLTVALADGCRPSAPPLEGRYVARVEDTTLELDFNRTGYVMLNPGSIRYEWNRSNDTVFVHGGPQSQALVLVVRGDSLVTNLGYTLIRERKGERP